MSATIAATGPDNRTSIIAQVRRIDLTATPNRGAAPALATDLEHRVLAGEITLTRARRIQTAREAQ